MDKKKNRTENIIGVADGPTEMFTKKTPRKKARKTKKRSLLNNKLLFSNVPLQNLGM